MKRIAFSVKNFPCVKTIMGAVLLLSSLTCMAQREVGTWAITPKVGVNIARLTDADVYVDTNEKMKPSNKVGLVAGAEAEYQWKSKLSLSTAVLYSNQGTRMSDNAVFRDMSYTLHYVNVPVTANLFFASNVAFRLGLQPGWALGTRDEFDENDGKGNWRHHSSSDTWFKAFDLSIPVGLSWNVGPVQLDARYNFGLTNTTKYDLMKMRNRVIQLTVGYRFEL